MIRAWLAILVVVIAGAAGAQPGNRNPVVENPEGVRQVAGLLVEATTRDALTDFVGTTPVTCVATTPGAEICEWRLARNDSGWRPLARAIDTGDRIALLCELPSDGQARAARSCYAFPRRSNRISWYVQRRPNYKSGARRERPGKTLKRYEKMASNALDAARTLRELSLLVGAAPNECTLRGSQRLCVWRATSRTYGHGTLAVAADISKSKKVRLRCTLPADGSQRGADSCRVEIGA